MPLITIMTHVNNVFLSFFRLIVDECQGTYFTVFNRVIMAETKMVVKVEKATSAITQGTLFKRGHVNTSWKQRWFKLTSDAELKYYETKTKPSSKPYGNINLLEVERMEVSHTQNVPQMSIPAYAHIRTRDINENESRSFIIYLVTEVRTWILSADSKESFMKWVGYLHRCLYEQIVFESLMKLKTTTRYFTLNTSKLLKYYESQNRQKLLGCIDLNDSSIEYHAESIKHTHLIYILSELQNLALSTTEIDIFRSWIIHLNINVDGLYDLGKFDEEQLVFSDNEDLDDMLDLSGQNLQSISLPICEQNASEICTLILTKNYLSSLTELKHFTNLNILQLDRNGLECIDDMPYLPQLKTLWLNNNSLNDLETLLTTLQKQVNVHHTNLGIFNLNHFAQNK